MSIEQLLGALQSARGSGSMQKGTTAIWGGFPHLQQDVLIFHPVCWRVTSLCFMFLEKCLHMIIVPSSWVQQEIKKYHRSALNVCKMHG